MCRRQEWRWHLAGKLQIVAKALVFMRFWIEIWDLGTPTVSRSFPGIVPREFPWDGDGFPEGSPGFPKGSPMRMGSPRVSRAIIFSCFCWSYLAKWALAIWRSANKNENWMSKIKMQFDWGFISKIKRLRKTNVQKARVEMTSSREIANRSKKHWSSCIFELIFEILI